jgi:hypothetical protein
MAVTVAPIVFQASGWPKSAWHKALLQVEARWKFAGRCPQWLQMLVPLRFQRFLGVDNSSDFSAGANSIFVTDN